MLIIGETRGWGRERSIALSVISAQSSCYTKTPLKMYNNKKINQNNYKKVLATESLLDKHQHF